MEDWLRIGILSLKKMKYKRGAEEMTRTLAALNKEVCVLFTKSRKIDFATDRDHYIKPQPIKMQSCVVPRLS